MMLGEKGTNPGMRVSLRRVEKGSVKETKGASRDKSSGRAECATKS